MKTTLELPDELLRAIKVRAASTDRKLKDVIAEAIALGLNALIAHESTGADAQRLSATAAGAVRYSRRSRLQVSEAQPPESPAAPVRGATISREAIDAIFAAGEKLVREGLDVDAWVKHSRDVWR